jgi:hypothetical protein
MSSAADADADSALGDGSLGADDALPPLRSLGDAVRSAVAALAMLLVRSAFSP